MLQKIKLHLYPRSIGEKYIMFHGTTWKKRVLVLPQTYAENLAGLEYRHVKSQNFLVRINTFQTEFLRQMRQKVRHYPFLQRKHSYVFATRGYINLSIFFEVAFRSFSGFLETFPLVWKISRSLKAFRVASKFLRWSINFLCHLETFQSV